MVFQDLNWKNVELVPFKKKYFDFIYDCYQDFSTRSLFTSDVTIQSKNDFWNIFIKKSENYYHEFMIILDSMQNNPLGFVNSFNYNSTDGYLYIAMFIQKKYRKSIIPMEAGIVFLNYLFSNYPIRKIYCTVFDYNKDSINFLNKAGFLLEGELKKHKYYNGNYHSMKIFVLYREGLKDILKKYKYEI